MKHKRKIKGDLEHCVFPDSPYENDGVIQKALTKSKVSFSVEMPSEAQSVWQNLPMGEKTEYGCTILPDNESTVGWGPIYACRLRRNN